MIKKTLLTLLTSTALLATGNAKENNDVLRIKGSLKNFGDTAIVLIKKPERNADAQKDTIILKNGKFDFTVKIKNVSDAYLGTPNAIRGEKGGGYVSFIAVPGETIELTGDLETHFNITGTKFYKEYHEVDLMLENAQKDLKELMKSLTERMEKGEDQEVLMKEFYEKAGPMNQKVLATILDFIKQHPTYEASATIINRLEDLDQMEEAVKGLSAEVREGRMKPYYMEYLNRQRERKAIKERAKKAQATGVAAPDFTLKDLQDKPLSLSSLKGKYVILDFWGAWCGWCIKGFPQMKEYYNKYKGKFEILGIDCNDTPEKWRDAVKKHELPWLQVYNPKGSKVLEDYAIQGFPTKIIVGPDGKIVKTIVGEDPAFYTLLDELFK